MGGVVGGLLGTACSLHHPMQMLHFRCPTFWCRVQVRDQRERAVITEAITRDCDPNCSGGKFVQAVQIYKEQGPRTERAEDIPRMRTANVSLLRRLDSVSTSKMEKRKDKKKKDRIPNPRTN